MRRVGVCPDTRTRLAMDRRRRLVFTPHVCALQAVAAQWWYSARTAHSRWVGAAVPPLGRQCRCCCTRRIQSLRLQSRVLAHAAIAAACLYPARPARRFSCAGRGAARCRRGGGLHSGRCAGGPGDGTTAARRGARQLMLTEGVSSCRTHMTGALRTEWSGRNGDVRHSWLAEVGPCRFAWDCTLGRANHLVTTLVLTRIDEFRVWNAFEVHVPACMLVPGGKNTGCAYTVCHALQPAMLGSWLDANWRCGPWNVLRQPRRRAGDQWCTVEDGERWRRGARVA